MDFEALNPETVSSISVAAKVGNVQALQFLLEKGKASNIQDNNGWRALHHASYAGNLECVKLLIKAPDVDLNATSFDRQTALSLACSSNKKATAIFSVAKTLLESGADPNVEIKDQYANIFNEAVHVNYLPLVQLLVDYKVRISEVDSKYGSPLNVVAETGSMEMLQYLLKQKLVMDPKHLPSWRFFFILLYDFNEKEDMLRLILKRPGCLAQINCQNQSQTTPLSFACSLGCEKAIDLLLDYGADPNLKDQMETLPLCEAAAHLPDESVSENGVFVRLFRLTCRRDIRRVGQIPMSSLIFAILSQGKKKKMLEFVLREGKLTTDVTFPSRTLQCWADPLLLSLYFKRTDRLSPLAVLCGCLKIDDLDMARLLLKDIDLNDTSVNRIPPLAEVATAIDGFSSFGEERFEIIYYMLSQGADVMLKARKDDPLPTVFLIAILQRTPVCLEFLLLHSIPAEIVFTNDVFDYLATSFMGYIAQLPRGPSNSPNTYSAVHIRQWLLTVNKYLPQFPPKIYEFLSFVYCLETTSVERCHAVNPTRMHESAENFLREVMDSPKTLTHLTSLRIRLILWEGRKNVLISTSVQQLCQKLRLPPIIRKLLMFDMDTEFDRIPQ